MKQKSITFRCTQAQFDRMQQNLQTQNDINRSSVLSAALEEFLDFIESSIDAEADLFTLVDLVNNVGDRTSFCSQAK